MPNSELPPTTIPAHLVRRFKELDADVGFGIVGDFALRLFSELYAEGFPVLVTADEQGAAFAADAYARIRGFGVVVCTYGVGGLKMANAAAGAWAEYVPLLILSGAPGLGERSGDPMLHHKVKGFDTQLRVFEDLTCAQAVLTSNDTATNEIDRVLSTMLSEQRPGYIEVPRDMVSIPVDPPDFGVTPHDPPVNEAALRAALSDVLSELREARTGAVHAGALVGRRGLAAPLFALATAADLPVATSSLGRGVFPERHPLGLGMYMGAVSPAEIVKRVESADVVLSLGVLQTDLTLGGFTAGIDHDRLVLVDDREVTVGYRTYRDVPITAFLPALAEAVQDAGIRLTHDAKPTELAFEPSDSPLTIERAMAAIEAHIDDRHGLLLEPGEALFASADLLVPAWSHGSAYYATMGYAVPAALGAGKADPGRRPIVIVGDGAFAMTGLEVAACAFHDVPAVFIVLDNDGYGTQRPILEGPFNDIPKLAAERLVDVIGTGRGRLVQTERQLDDALREALADDDLAIIRVQLPKDGRSAGLARLGEALRKRA